MLRALLAPAAGAPTARVVVDVGVGVARRYRQRADGGGRELEEKGKE